MLDWLYPGDAVKPKRTYVRQQHPLLQVCSHIANGSKHFEATAKHHHSVKDTSSEGTAFNWRAFDGNVFQGGNLLITLDSQAATDLGPTVEATTLAAKVVQFWESYPDLQ